MLMERIPISLITGIIVTKAHRQVLPVAKLLNNHFSVSIYPLQTDFVLLRLTEPEKEISVKQLCVIFLFAIGYKILSSFKVFFMVFRLENIFRIMDSAQDSFILRLYRQKNKEGFIKAFSASPVSFSAGFCQVWHILKKIIQTYTFIFGLFSSDTLLMFVCLRRCKVLPYRPCRL